MDSALLGDEAEASGEYAVIVVGAGEPRSVWHSIADGVAVLRQHMSKLCCPDLQAAGLGAYKKLPATL